MDKEKVINKLKEYIDPSHLELNDFDVIYDRRELVDDVYLFKLSFVDVYLDENCEVYDVSPNHSNLQLVEDFTDDERIIVDLLKSYCSPRHYDLNDWRKIIDRKVVDDDGISMYRTSFADIYLDKNNNFYDISPFEVDDTINILSNNLDDAEILKISKIKQYVLPQHYDLINWQIVLKRVKQINNNLFLYPLGIMDLYLDNDLNIVDYERCHIINNEFWYDFNKHPIVAGEQYTYITDL